jgi:hypothetical protein
VLWSLLSAARGSDAPPPAASDIVPVQTFAAVCAGATSGLLTTPLDVVKTRLQTAPFEPGKPKPTFRSVAAQLLREEGAAGFMRGVVPRVSSAMVRRVRCEASAALLTAAPPSTALGHLHGQRVRAAQAHERARRERR